MFLSAGSDDVARMYGRLGFERVGTAGIAQPRDGVSKLQRAQLEPVPAVRGSGAAGRSPPSRAR